MATVRFSRQSRADLVAIWRGLAALNELAANRTIDRIEDTCRLLQTFPDLGPHRPDIQAGVRMLVVDRWLVIYRSKGNIVFVVRVLDGRRDLTKLVGPPAS